MAEEEKKAAGPIRMVAIDNTVESIRYRSQILARTNKLDSGIIGTGIIGFTLGLFIAMVLIVIPAYLV